MAVDANFDDVDLLVNFDGVENQTTLTDLSNNALAFTCFNQARITQTQAKFGSGSATFDGVDDYIQTADTAVFGYGTGPWTFECWVRLTSSSAVPRVICDLGTGSSTLWGWIVLQTTRRLGIARDDAAFSVLSTGTQVPINTWTHIAVCWDGTTVRGFINGNVEFSSSLYIIDLGASRRVRLGTDKNGANDFIGQIDDVRMTGMARYTAAFTPPTEPFPNFSVVSGAAYDSQVQRLPSVQSLLYLASASDSDVLRPPEVLGLHPPAASAVLEPLLNTSPALLLAWPDFHQQVVGSVVTSTMEVTLSDNSLVAIPISSWQATLQSGGECYLRCSIPSPTAFIDAVADAVSFAVTLRTSAYADGFPVTRRIECPGPLSVQIDQGSANYSAQISGYFLEYPAKTYPVEWQARGVQIISTYPETFRVRCAVNYVIEPGDVLTTGDVSFTVSYINMYAGESVFYMDVGSRA